MPADPSVSPLTNKDRIEINKSLHAINQLNFELDRAEQAGIDVSEPRRLATYYTGRLTQLKSSYFPNSP